ncbi:hypothetical protein [Halomonas sp. BN3-1]|uniref:hypothetical protein n=1 Tax=Halomonas sp. BN3-1 TaxID=2082393 RepID=UPI000D382CF6|nr:hypothetical protein [Halomonas sp. BN3-1]
MARRIDQILSASAQRSLSASEIDLLGSYIRDLEKRKARPDHELERALARTEEELKNCRWVLNKNDINEKMD